MAKSENLKQKAYTVIKGKILNNELKPNEYLEEKLLCDMLGISRTPIREAISQLAFENLVQIIPHKGIFVADLSVQSVKELFQARHLIEPMILKLSYQNLEADILLSFKERFCLALDQKDYPLLHRLDYEFHQYLSSSCGNSYLMKMMGNISDNFQRVRTQSFFTKERTENGAREHLELIDILIKKDIDQALVLLDKHIFSTEFFFSQSIQN